MRQRIAKYNCMMLIVELRITDPATFQSRSIELNWKLCFYIAYIGDSLLGSLAQCEALDPCAAGTVYIR